MFEAQEQGQVALDAVDRLGGPGEGSESLRTGHTLSAVDDTMVLKVCRRSTVN